MKNIFKNYILFDCQIIEKLNKKNKPTKNLLYLPEHSKLTKTTLRNYNCLCIKTGSYENKDGLLLIDFDNKNDEEAFNGMELYNKLIHDNIIIPQDNYIEKTPNGGIHLIVKCDNNFLNNIKKSQTNFTFNNILYHVDIKGNNSFSIIAPTQFKTYDNKLTKHYEILHDKLNFISDELKEIIFNGLVKKTKKSKKTNNIKIDNHIVHDKNTNLKLLESIVNLINSKTSDNFNSWIEIGMALKNENIHSFYIFDKFSKLSSKYEGTQITLNKWNSFYSSSVVNGLQIGTLRMYAKRDNPTEYSKLIKIIDDPKLNDILTLNQTFFMYQRYIYDDCFFNGLENSDSEIMKLKNIILDFIFGNNKVLTIKSGMNTGKTLFIKNLLLSNLSTFKRVLFLTHRIDFSNSIYGSFENLGFKHYIQDKEEITITDKVIISIDSLHKIFNYNCKPFDLIIMDECESLLNHYSSPTLDGNNEYILNAYLQLCKDSKKYIVFRC